VSLVVQKRNTLSHVRIFLGRIDADIGLLQVSATFRQVPLEIDAWKRGELRRWCFERVKAIAGTDSLDDALRHPDVLTLLALGYVALGQVSDFTPPAKPSIPTPRFLKALEGDFLPALLKEARSQIRFSPAFKERLEHAERRVEQLVRSLESISSPSPSQQSTAAGHSSAVAMASDSGWRVIDVLAVICAVAYVVGKLTKKNK